MHRCSATLLEVQSIGAMDRSRVDVHDVVVEAATDLAVLARAIGKGGEDVMWPVGT